MNRDRWYREDPRRREPERDYGEFMDEYESRTPPAGDRYMRPRRESQMPDDYRDYRDRSDPRPSNYTRGGHGSSSRGEDYDEAQQRRRSDRDKFDNRDYRMNRDYERGSWERDPGYEPRPHERHPDDEAFNQSDWTARDSFGAERSENGYRHSYEASHPQLAPHFDRHFDYRYGSDDIDFDSREERAEPRRKPHRHSRRMRRGY